MTATPNRSSRIAYEVRRYLGGALAVAFLLAAPAKAERPTTNDIYSYLAQAGQITFNKAGGAFLPIAVLRGMKNGQISPILQFVLVNNLMTQCIKSVLEAPPGIREPYVVAKAKFDYGLCRLTQCFKQGMLIMVLPALSGKSGTGGKGVAQALATGFKQQEGCDGSGDSGMDPMLFTLLLSGG